MKMDRPKRIEGRVLKVGADTGSLWIRKTPAPTATSGRVENIHFASAPMEAGGHIRIDGDQIILRNMTVFAGSLDNWAAIRWGVFGLLRLGVIRRQKIRRVLRIRQMHAEGDVR
ncbi:hypothetical protein [uncultured Microbacterium sp.]|uniref:hypothetical protein n=1 Tax=uncultured Microbacterium sp. TaxID=191216 RepID=UPI0025D4ED22|nr:hypothetical protein [uncultured Microbacterium sp.]